MPRIKKIKAREILDSRGFPTVEVEVVLDNNIKAWAAVPSGASIGRFEALELRDKDKKRYFGKGVLKAINNVNKIIAPKLRGKDPKNQKLIDELMIKLDGTKNKSKLGANATLGVSLAVARAAAILQAKPLYLYLRQKFFKNIKGWNFPVPMMNIINGGVHADFSLDIQEFMILPQQKNIKEAIRCGVEVFHTLGKILKSRKYMITMGDEGGYAPRLKNNEQALDLILQAINKSGYAKNIVKLALDVAASQLYNKKEDTYQLKKLKKKYSKIDLINWYKEIIKKYPIISIEDGLNETDWDGWQELTRILGKRINIIGDDLFVTNIDKLKQGVKYRIANSILIKPNQVGTLIETINCIKLAKKKFYKVIISHRSGETADDFIADLSVACQADYLKAGSLARGERVIKYNRLMEIKEEIK